MNHWSLPPFAYRRRDLVRELADQCDRKGLSFFAYYSHALTTDLLPIARPQ